LKQERARIALLHESAAQLLSTSGKEEQIERIYQMVGGFFGAKTYSRNRSELIIFMTPHVIYDTNDLLEASQELQTRVRKLRKYINQ